jgi:hypothetical protein
VSAVKGAAAEGVPIIEEAIAGCEPFEDDGFTWTPGLLSFPELGDDSGSDPVDRRAGQGQRRRPLVFIVHHDLVVTVGVVAVFDDATALLEEFAPLALDKVVATLG